MYACLEVWRLQIAIGIFERYYEALRLYFIHAILRWHQHRYDVELYRHQSTMWFTINAPWFHLTNTTTQKVIKTAGLTSIVPATTGKVFGHKIG